MYTFLGAYPVCICEWPVANVLLQRPSYFYWAYQALSSFAHMSSDAGTRPSSRKPSETAHGCHRLSTRTDGGAEETLEKSQNCGMHGWGRIARSWTLTLMQEVVLVSVGGWIYWFVSPVPLAFHFLF